MKHLQIILSKTALWQRQGKECCIAQTITVLGLQKERAFLTSWEFYDFANRATDHQKMAGELEPNRPIDVFYAATDKIDESHRTVLSDRY